MSPPDDSQVELPSADKPVAKTEPMEEDASKPLKEARAGSLRKGMGLVDAIALITGGIIGSGIFITPTSILDLTGSFGLSMLCWLAGMLIAVCGGLCYIELNLLLPRTGGEVVYMLEGYSFRNRNKWTQLFGSLVAFLFTWATIVIIRPASVAIITLSCTRYLVRPFYLDCEDLPEDLIKCLALSILLLQSFIVSLSVKLMAKISTFITFFKILSIIFIVLVGVSGVIKRGHFPSDLHHPFQGSHITSPSDVGNLALALYSVLWAYDGWNAFGYAIEEVKRPERNLPRSMVIGMVIISLCYLLVNLSFFSILSYDEIRGTQAVALPFGEAVMGEAGLAIFPILVAISAFGAAVLSTYVASRVIFGAAREGQIPEVFCGIHVKLGTPMAAILLQTAMTTMYILAGNIDSLIEGFSASVWLFYILSFISILIMRFTHKDHNRPFKVWWIVPVIMTVVGLFLVILPLTNGPGWTLAVFGLILSGVPVYLLLVMVTPWRIRPALFDRYSEFITKHGNRLLQAKSAR